MRKSMTEFIKENRDELSQAIHNVLNFVPRQAGCDCHRRGTDHHHENDRTLTIKDIREWVMNDESLYNWARSEGVKV